MERFVDKIGVVTGAASGIGAAIAKELLKKGVNVVGLDISSESLQILSDEITTSSEYLGKFYTYIVDVKNEKQIEESFKWINSELGPVAILVNNCAVLMPTFLTDVTGEQIQEIYDVNVRGLILCSKAALKTIEDKDLELHIVNIDCISGHTIMNRKPHILHLYSSTKHAVRLISEGLRRELGEKHMHVKVTNLCPGITDTDMARSLPEKPVKFLNVKSPELFADNRLLLPVDVAKAVIHVIDTPYRVLYSEVSLLPSNINF